MVPSIRECFYLMDKYRMLENIKAHSIVVARVTRLIAHALREAEIDISVKLATAAALLHDIGKTSSLKSRQDHSEIGRQICLKNHLDEIAPIVAEHVRLKNYSLNGNYSEKEIVYWGMYLTQVHTTYSVVGYGGRLPKNTDRDGRPVQYRGCLP
ncbi:MAG: HD domain-containing protein [Proteobacteria bacterium]|nr:HD domain-containing protein [Pseudomonadota bacterium]